MIDNRTTLEKWTRTAVDTKRADVKRMVNHNVMNKDGSRRDLSRAVVEIKLAKILCMSGIKRYSNLDFVF